MKAIACRLLAMRQDPVGWHGSSIVRKKRPMTIHEIPEALDHRRSEYLIEACNEAYTSNGDGFDEFPVIDVARDNDSYTKDVGGINRPAPKAKSPGHAPPPTSNASWPRRASSSGQHDRQRR